jgi:membrane-associated phospholipid phosphatase
VKLFLTVALNLFFWIGYGFLSRHAFFPTHMLPLTWMDRSVPFQPEPWSWIYMSEFVLTGTVPWFITRRETLWRYAAGVLVLSTISFAGFLFFPVASPRIGLEVPNGMMTVITKLDGPLNAFPSLHAGFIVFTLGMAWTIFRGRVSLVLIVSVAAWALAVMYATIATRQHYALDLLAGAAVGSLALLLAWRSPRIAVSTMRRSNAVESHAGFK